MNIEDIEDIVIFAIAATPVFVTVIFGIAIVFGVFP